MKSNVKENCSEIADQALNAGIEAMKTESLTFAVRHAESIENFNVIDSNVPPALSLHQTFQHHLEKNTFLATSFGYHNGTTMGTVV